MTVVESAFVAVDLGAESGRAVLGRFDGEQMVLEVMHRFPNTPVRLPDGLHWEVLRIFSEVKDGLARTAGSGGRIERLGVDAWGVDFALLDRDGSLISRSKNHGRVPPPLRSLNGIYAGTSHRSLTMELAVLRARFRKVLKAEPTWIGGDSA